VVRTRNDHRHVFASDRQSLLKNRRERGSKHLSRA
jgi:hypothetical protein